MQKMERKDEILAAFAARINELCDEKQIPPKGKNRQALFAKEFGLSQKGVRKWLEGEGLPAMSTALLIADWADVNINWLYAGRGPKRNQPQTLPIMSKPMEHVFQVMQNMDSDDQYLAARLVDQVSKPEEKPNDGTQ